MSHTENLNQTWQSHLELLGLGHAVDLILLSPHVSVALGLGTLPGDNLLGAHLLPHHEPASDRPAHAQGCGTCPTETRAPWPRCQLCSWPHPRRRPARVFVLELLQLSQHISVLSSPVSLLPGGGWSPRLSC